MTNEIRLFVEVVLFVVVMVGVTAFTAYLVIMNRRRSPDELEKLRRLVAHLTDDLATLTDEMNSRMDEYDRRQEVSRRELERVHKELAAWKNHSRRQAAHSQMLVDMLHEMGFTGDIPPLPEPPSATFPPLKDVPNEEQLPETLAALFNIEELDDLILRVGGRPEDLMGTTIGRRAGSLVLWARRRGKLDKLVSVARQLRPDGGI